MPLYVDVSQMQAADYEPCTGFCEVTFDVTEFNVPVDATVVLTQDETSAGGRSRTRLIIQKK